MGPGSRPRPMPRIRLEPTLEMAREMAPNLRAADVLEVHRAGRHTPLQALELGLEGTRNGFWIEHEGEPVAIGGSCPVPGGDRVECPWMLGTDFITHHRVWFLRHTPEIWATVERDYRFLWNMVDARNYDHVRWLQWSGCTFTGERELNGNPFLEFVKICASP